MQGVDTGDTICPESPPQTLTCLLPGRDTNPSGKAVVPVEGTPGFLVRSAHRSLGGSVHSWLCSWQEWLGAGAGMTLQSEALWLWSRWERSPLPRPLHPILPCLTTSWEWGSAKGTPPPEVASPLLLPREGQLSSSNGL